MEVVGVGVLLIAEVEPCVRVLVNEQRSVEIRDVSQTLVCEGWTSEYVPGGGCDWIRGRADRQKVEHHQFAVSIPARRDEAVLGRPSHREGWSAVQHPRPVNAVVNLRGEVLDLSVPKILTACEHTAKKDRGIDG